MIRHRLVFVVFMLCSLLALTSSAANAGNEPPLRFSPEKITLEGVIDDDTFTATFYLLTSATEVKSINLFASDLVSANGAHISGTDYQVAPGAVGDIPAYNGKMVTLTVAKVKAAGVYTGTILAMYEGASSVPGPQLKVELIAKENPVVTLAKDSSQVSIVATRPTFPFGRQFTAPAVIHLRQTGTVTATLIEISQMGPASAQDAKPLPQTTLIITPTAPLILSPDIWQPITVTVDAAALHAGHYGATLVLTPQGAADLEVGIDVKLRDAWLWPLLCLLVGVALSFAVAAYASVGKGRLKALATVDDIRATLATPEGLPADRVEEWQRELRRLEDRARTEPSEKVQPDLDALATRIKAGETTYDTLRKQLADWEQMVKGWTKNLSPEVVALAGSPWLTRIRAKLADIEVRLGEGGFERGEMEAEIYAIGSEVTMAAELVKALPLALASPDLTADQKEEIRDAVAAKPASIDALQAIIGLLKDKKLMPEEPPVVVAVSFAAAREVEGEPIQAGAGQRTSLSSRLKGHLGKAWDWLKDPRHYWRIVGYLLSLLFLAGLLVAGMIALYVDNETFGANRFAAYVALVLWGLGADASRRKLQDLQGVTDFLTERLGLNK